MSAHEPEMLLSRDRFIALIRALQKVPEKVAPDEVASMIVSFEGIPTPDEPGAFEMPNPSRTGWITWDTDTHDVWEVNLQTSPEADLNAPMLVDTFADQVEWATELLGEPSERRTAQTPTALWHMINGDLSVSLGYEVVTEWRSATSLENVGLAAQVGDDALG